MAAVLAAGLLGIENKLEPGEASEPGVPAEDDPRFSPLPTHLHASLDALEQAGELRDLLGDEFVRIYTTVRRYEIARFEDHVTDWEREEYARVY
jgi:glutamine synthetase